ncbi:hypothetical protein MBLNU457_3464t1 [Dothideomycetes sp. NU457]
MTQQLKPPLRPQRTRSTHRVHSGSSTHDQHDSQATEPDSAQPKTRPEARSAEDEATAAFVRRTLCAHNLRTGAGDTAKGHTTSQPLEDLLPPLTSSNEVDLQLYAIISVIIKDFVQTWYTKITPDHEFVDEVIQIIAHCTRGLEQRLRRVDMESLLLDEIPGLLHAHVETYKVAHTPGDHFSLIGLSPRGIYHTLQPHPALSPVPLEPGSSAAHDQSANEAAWRQLLFEKVLTLLLPPEDLQNPCLRVLVNEILAELIMGNAVSGKACEGWLIWDGIAKALTKAQRKKEEVIEQLEPPAINRLEQFGLLPEKQDPINEAPAKSTNSIPPRVAQLLFELLRLLAMAYVFLRMAIVTFMDSASLPSRLIADHPKQVNGTSIHSSHASVSSTSSFQFDTAPQRPILEMMVWSVPSQLLSLDLRMPWLVSSLSFIQYYLINGPGKLCSTDGRLDRLLSHTLHTHLLSPKNLPTALLTLRQTLFPNNSLAPGRPAPTPSEIQDMKRAAANAIIDALPEMVRKVYFAGAERSDMISDVEAMLDVFGDSYLNRHFVFAVVEVLVVRLFPEMSVGAGR